VPRCSWCSHRMKGRARGASGRLSVKAHRPHRTYLMPRQSRGEFPHGSMTGAFSHFA
jgi:hypothetical protein